ncbi:PREDICTED: SKP1-like protein 1A [Camelina sativa]|uniref:SKP1-like protein 1A n=1 Tax=Camelina sativa TaxID=90675 RepID=A0ABM0YU51_CAMSA|nr:PREDICTED: SKP1-like protein 1A [Camelina sativa]
MADAFKTTSESGLDKEFEDLTISDNQIQERIVLKSSDDEIFEVDEATARQILTPAALLVKDSHVKQAAVPVKGKILAKLIEYCKKLVDGAVSSSGEYHLRKWEAEFMEVDQSTLFQIMMAA